jgi:hypothetical protein
MPLSDHIKPDAHRPPTREEIERGRALYVEGFTTSRCCAGSNMSLGTLYYWLDGGPQGPDGPLLPPIPRRRNVAGRRRRPLPAVDRVSLAARLWRTAERQARDIEERLARANEPPAERERDTRMLALLVKTLRELSAFDAGASKPDETDAYDDDYDHVPRELDDLRQELSRRLDAMAEGEKARAQAQGNTPDGA